MKQIKVLKIKNTDCFYFRSRYGNGEPRIYINGVIVEDPQFYNGFSFSEKDKVQYMSSSQISHYVRDGYKMSLEDYKSKKTYYDSDSSDEETLRAIANKKDLEGFQAVYTEPELISFELEIIGEVSDTGSDFIRCSTPINQYSIKGIVYSLEVNKITIDEYNKLIQKYSSDANFEKIDRSYLRFAKVNNSYCFTDSYPFNEISSEKLFTDLNQAQSEEKNIRTLVKDRVLKMIFKQGLTDVKKTSIINYLNNIKKSKSKKTTNEMIDILIQDLKEYHNNIII